MQVAATPILLLTQDDFLWQHWRALENQHWLPARGRDLADLRRWHKQGRTIAILDAGLPGLPAWTPNVWQPLTNGMQTVIASVRPSDAEGMQTILCGARGYCHAYAPAATWAHVLNAVTTGCVWMGATLVARLLRQVNTLASASTRQPPVGDPEHWHHHLLTQREHTVAHLVAQGSSNSQIATELGLSERTVKAHLTTIFEKLAVKDRLQLALLVHGLTPAPV